VVLPIHIAAGSLAIVLGFTALAARKGGRTHRQAGLLFVFAMLTMGISGSIIALSKSWNDPNVIGGFMTAYFVVTGLTSVRAASRQTRSLNVAALMIAITLAGVVLTMGVMAYGMPRHAMNGVPAFMLFFLGTIFTLSAIGDIRLMRSGPLKGAPRIRRHLWRMLFALFIAAGSFFSIKARVARIFPEALTGPWFRLLPIVVIFGAMFYWMWRVRGRRPVPQRS
jgi:uncharacterized membrane protein